MAGTMGTDAWVVKEGQTAPSKVSREGQGAAQREGRPLEERSNNKECRCNETGRVRTGRQLGGVQGRGS